MYQSVRHNNNNLMTHVGFIMTIAGFLLVAFATPQQQPRHGNLAEIEHEAVR